eukprot:scaffold2273_cov209-Alexandrium_tamarense.AAC.6
MMCVELDDCGAPSSVLLSRISACDGYGQCSLPSLILSITNPLASPSSSSHSPRNNRKDQKKVDKLEAQIPYHEGRGNLDEVTKIKDQVEAIWAKAKEATFA